MNLNELFPGTYLKCADLTGKAVKVVMERLEEVELGGESKWALHFKDRKMSLVLNKTNAGLIAEHHGDQPRIGPQ